MVNDSTTKVFYVLHDDGNTITMQQRENTVSSVAWFKSNYVSGNTYGPTTVLSSLETATSGWTNVNEQTYAAAYTKFMTDAYTGCGGASTGCSSNQYTLASRTAKARLVTLQEIVAIDSWTYISGSGTYWTMSADTSGSSYAFTCGYNSNYGNTISVGSPSSASYGARAVVVISK